MAADERATITIDVDVKNLNRLQEVTAALEEMGIASELNAAKFSQLTGAMGKHSTASSKATKDSQKLYEKITLLDRATMGFAKQARKLMMGVIAMSIEFALSAVALASVNAAFVVGKVLLKGYHLAMQGLAGGVAAVGVAAIAAAAAFGEFQTAQYAFRYSSDTTSSSLDKSSFALRGLYKDTQLNIYGMKALSAAFAEVSKNAKFTGESQKMLQGFSDFIASSGDPTKSMQAAANAVGLLQKKQTGVNKNSKYMTAEALNAIKQINPALADMAKNAGVGGAGGLGSKEKFIEALLDGTLAQKAGVAGAANNLAGTLFAQFKAYLSTGLVELQDVGKRVLDPVKKAMHDIFSGLMKTFRRVSNDITSFGQGPFLKTIVGLVAKLENFTVTLFRKYLPTTQGFMTKMGNVFFQLKSWFRQVVTSLESMRNGGSVVIKTFGGPILEVFKQIGNNARSLADLASKNKDKFIAFGEGLKSVVQGFFGISNAFKEMFTNALPFITLVLKAVAKVAGVIESIFKMLSGLGSVGSSIGILGAGMAILKGTKTAQRKKGGGDSDLYGYSTISRRKAAEKNMTISKFGGGGPGQTGGTPLSGAMATAGAQVSTAMTTALQPGFSAVSSSANSAAEAMGRLATAATGAALKGGMTGGTVDTQGYIKTEPKRKPGQTDSDYQIDIKAWRDAQKKRDYLNSPSTKMINGEQVVLGNRPIPNMGQYTGFTPQALGNTALQAALNGPSPVSPGDLLTGTRYESPLKGFNPGVGSLPPLQGPGMYSYQPPASPVPETTASFKAGKTYGKIKNRFGKLKTGYSNFAAARDQFLFGAAGISGVTGAMPGGGAGGGTMNIAHTGTIPPGSRRDVGAIKFAQNKLGKFAFGNQYQGLGFKKELANLMTGKNASASYHGSLSQQMEQHVAAGGDPSKFVPNRKAAFKAGLRSQFSGGGAMVAAGASMLAAKKGTQEAQGSLQAGAGLMSMDAKLGIGVGGLGTAWNSRTKMGGAISGAIGGAAMGKMVADALPLGPIGKTIGMGVGALIGAGMGIIRAGANQRKLVKKAVGQIKYDHLQKLTGAVVEQAIAGTLSMSSISSKLGATQKLANNFRNAKTDSERKALLQPYIDSGTLTGNAAKDAVSGHYGSTQIQLDKDAANQKGVTNGLKQFDAVMKSLTLSTGKTKAEIFDLAMRKNVDLFDTTSKLSDITQKLGEGFVKTGKQMGDAFKDIRINAMGVFDVFKEAKQATDALQAAGNTLRSGGVQGVGAIEDYLYKFGDFLDYQNPDSPLTNIVSNLKTFGSGGAFGNGTAFQNNGALEGVTLDPKALALGQDFTNKEKLGASKTVANQIGAMLADNNMQGANADEMRKYLETKTANLMTTAAGSGPDAFAASEQLKKLQDITQNGTAFKGKSQAEVQAIINGIFGQPTTTKQRGGPDNMGFTGLGVGGANALELTSAGKYDMNLTVDEQEVSDAFHGAIVSAFADSKDSPQWWNTAPSWWGYTFNPKSGKFEPSPDTRSPRRGRIGDTGTPRALGATMAAHNSMNGMLTGKRSVTSSYRTSNLGSPSSDHAAGRAYDLTGQNLGQYASLAKSAGGFAEFHGAASSRHLHVVPSLGRSGDTSSPVGAMAMSGGSSYTAGDISITIVESKDAKATAKEVAREIIAMQKNERRRM